MKSPMVTVVFKSGNGNSAGGGGGGWGVTRDGRGGRWEITASPGKRAGREARTGGGNGTSPQRPREAARRAASGPGKGKPHRAVKPP